MRNIFCTVAVFLLALGVCFADDSMIVKNLTVENNPFDDGSGLIIRFDALPKDARIIEYRFYRGVSADTLFYIGSVEVNPNTGVTGGEVSFYDKDYRAFVDLDSPKRLRAERGQNPGSPIFRALPRDVSIVGPLLEHFSALAIIDKNIFYRKTTKHIIENDGQQELLGGLRIEDFVTILANIQPGKKYFYTVIAVDERRNFHPYAPIVYGIASDNLPEPVSNLFAKWIENTQMLNFEFDFPLFTGDIAQASIYMIDGTEIDALGDYRDYMFKLDEWSQKTTEGDTLAVRPNAVENPGRLLKVIPGTTLNFAKVKYEDGYLINESDGSMVAFDINDTQNHVFYVTLDDYAGFQAVSLPVIAERANSNLLPPLPRFEVRDKPNDKGDANEILIGTPLVQLSGIDFRGRRGDRRRLSFSYTYSPLPDFKVKSIKFDFLDMDGVHIASVTENFIDNVFNLNLPSTRYFDEGFQVFMSFNAPKTNLHQLPFLSQTIAFDEDLMMLRPGNLHLDGEELLLFRYQLLRQSMAGTIPSIVNRVTPLINSFDDFVGYEMYIYRGIGSYDIQRKQLLFDTTIDVGFDHEMGSPVMTNLFYEDFVNITQLQMAEYEEMLTEDPENEEALWVIDYLNNMIDMQTNHPLLSDINQISSYKNRVSSIMKQREQFNRTFKYSMVKTDGEALFVVSDVYRDENGNEYFYPTPDWFNSSSIPMLVASLVFAFLVFYSYRLTKSGKDLFIRPIAGIEEIDNAVGRATEMGRPMLFVPGLTSIDDVATLAALSILGHITKKAAQYDTKILVPCSDYIVLPIAQQIVKESYSVAGRPDSFDANDVFFVAYEQFAYVAGVNGIMIRQKTATNFYMGYFFAEALVMTETGNMTGAIQVAGTDAVTQIPFFITTCDYTLIGEELYAASAYLSKDPMILGTLKSQDYTKLIIIACIFLGTLLSTINVTGMINWFPAE